MSLFIGLKLSLFSQQPHLKFDNLKKVSGLNISLNILFFLSSSCSSWSNLIALFIPLLSATQYLSQVFNLNRWPNFHIMQILNPLIIPDSGYYFSSISMSQFWSELLHNKASKLSFPSGVINPLSHFEFQSAGAPMPQKGTVDYKQKHIKVMHKSTSLLWLMYANWMCFLHGQGENRRELLYAF